MVSLKKRRLKKDTNAVFQYLKDCHWEKGVDLFSIILQGKTKSIGERYRERSKLKIWRDFLTMKLLGSRTAYPMESQMKKYVKEEDRTCWYDQLHRAFSLDQINNDN